MLYFKLSQIRNEFENFTLCNLWLINIIYSFFNLVEYQIYLVGLIYLNKLRCCLMLSFSFFILLIYYLPIFILFNFVFEVQIFRLWFSGSEIFKWFSHIIMVNSIFWYCIEEVNHRLIFIVTLILFCLVFIVFKNISIDLWQCSLWHIFQQFIDFINNFFFRHFLRLLKYLVLKFIQ